jgi:hypothetical protein
LRGNSAKWFLIAYSAASQHQGLDSIVWLELKVLIQEILATGVDYPNSSFSVPSQCIVRVLIKQPEIIGARATRMREVYNFQGTEDHHRKLERIEKKILTA